MKLGELKSQIRHRKGNPSVMVPLIPGADKIEITVQKASLLEALDRAFPGGRGAETNLRLNDESGLLVDEGAPPVSMAAPAGEAEVDELDDLDDLPELPDSMDVQRGMGSVVDEIDEIDEL